MDKKVKLSVVMPTLNEEKSVGKVIGDIQKYAKDYDLEVVIVDSSTDRTPRIAEEMGARVIRQEPRGPGRALLLGLKEAKGDILMMTDCDDTYPMEDIPKFVGYIQQGYDFVNGNRINDLHDNMPRFNRFGNWAFAFLVRTLFGINTRDVTSGMRMYTRELFHSSQWEGNLAFWTEIIIKAKLGGFKYLDVPIMYRPRIGVPTLNAWKSSKALLLCILKYRFNLGFIDLKKL